MKACAYVIIARVGLAILSFVAALTVLGGAKQDLPARVSEISVTLSEVAVLLEESFLVRHITRFASASGYPSVAPGC